ncbi:MAG: DUF4209 domain-containing protein [Candidatus Jettenia sp.]|nr:DUF4209 domain-containing protein [Candidatus Jettenia sp.]
MSAERYPQNLVITVDNFRNSNWRETIENAGERSYPIYWDLFLKAAHHAMGDGNTAKGKVLWLLADVCSMMLKPESINEPFQPFVVMQGKRSAIPEDFTNSDLVFFEDILPEIEDYCLKARIADTLWLVRQPRKVQYALSAIDSYIQFPLDVENLLRDGKEAWHRAIRLALILKNGAGDRLQNIRDSIFSKFQTTNFCDQFHALWLADLLEMAYLEEVRSNDVAAKLSSFAQNAKDAQYWHCAREYFEGAIRWYKRINKEDEVHHLYVNMAETWVSEAEQRTSDDNPSNMVAGHFLERAIQTFRKIPKKERTAYKVDERIENLHKKMKRANKLALDEMRQIETPGHGISQSVEASRNHVTGRNFPEVLLAFANIYPRVIVDQIRENAKKSMQRSILRHLCTSIHMTQDGRVASKSVGLNFDDTNSPETQQAIWHEMIRNYSLQISLVVQANILPALQVLNAEHRLTERTLLSICRRSHIIPPDREVLWAKGLFFGFGRDFVVSTHLLIPQLEHLVRIIMKQSEFKTTTLDSNGIETENGLSALLDNPDTEKVMDKNLIFEFKALLSDAVGPNLRNEMAHGLLEADRAESVYAIYLWWLCLRLIINSIPWQNHKK